MTTLRERVEARMNTRGPRCVVCIFLAQQSKPLRAEWCALLAEPKEVITHRAIAGEMSEQARRRDKAAASISDFSVGRHRSEHHGQ